MKVLLAEDDERLGELIVHLLKKKGASVVDWVTEGEDAIAYAQASFYDVVILDWMMPNGDGVSVCRHLREAGYSGAVLMLTAKGAVPDRVEGLDAGADDYIVKPFEIEELWARLNALTRRTRTPIREETVMIGELLLNRTSHTLYYQEEEILLTPREFQLFELLVVNRGQVLTRELILDRIWGLDAEVSLKTIDATVKLLRKKISRTSKEDFIKAVRGVGYKIEA